MFPVRLAPVRNQRHLHHLHHLGIHQAAHDTGFAFAASTRKLADALHSLLPEGGLNRPDFTNFSSVVMAQ